MAQVDPLFAQWLQDEGLWLVREDAERVGRWGDTALLGERMTSIAFKGDAQAEADRQLAFLGGPLALDEHLLVGEWRHLRGQVITLTIDKLGYSGGVDVFLLSAEDDKASGLSRVTVIRRL
ncbi:hypothetical protein [Sphingomonas sp.]|uniref:hypothetical protein n=1 Tax=Sphingomonas sp. TaxID=28214 RepID=UPI00307F97F2